MAQLPPRGRIPALALATAPSPGPASNPIPVPARSAAGLPPVRLPAISPAAAPAISPVAGPTEDERMALLMAGIAPDALSPVPRDHDPEELSTANGAALTAAGKLPQPTAEQSELMSKLKKLAALRNEMNRAGTAARSALRTTEGAVVSANAAVKSAEAAISGEPIKKASPALAPLAVSHALRTMGGFAPGPGMAASPTQYRRRGSTHLPPISIVSSSDLKDDDSDPRHKAPTAPVAIPSKVKAVKTEDEFDSLLKLGNSTARSESAAGPGARTSHHSDSDKDSDEDVSTPLIQEAASDALPSGFNKGDTVPRKYRVGAGNAFYQETRKLVDDQEQSPTTDDSELTAGNGQNKSQEAIRDAEDNVQRARRVEKAARLRARAALAEANAIELIAKDAAAKAKLDQEKAAKAEANVSKVGKQAVDKAQTMAARAQRQVVVYQEMVKRAQELLQNYAQQEEIAIKETQKAMKVLASLSSLTQPLLEREGVSPSAHAERSEDSASAAAHDRRESRSAHYDAERVAIRMQIRAGLTPDIAANMLTATGAGLALPNLSRGPRAATSSSPSATSASAATGSSPSAASASTAAGSPSPGAVSANRSQQYILR